MVVILVGGGVLLIYAQPVFFLLLLFADAAAADAGFKENFSDSLVKEYLSSPIYDRKFFDSVYHVLLRSQRGDSEPARNEIDFSVEVIRKYYCALRSDQNRGVCVLCFNLLYFFCKNQLAGDCACVNLFKKRRNRKTEASMINFSLKYICQLMASLKMDRPSKVLFSKGRSDQFDQLKIADWSWLICFLKTFSDYSLKKRDAEEDHEVMKFFLSKLVCLVDLSRKGLQSIDVSVSEGFFPPAVPARAYGSFLPTDYVLASFECEGVLSMADLLMGGRN